MSPRRWLFVGILGLMLLLAGGYFFLAPVWNALLARMSRPTPVVTVEAVYPGASAQVVADTVAAPIEQQVNGVESMVGMWSESRNDGTYTLHVVFDDGIDLNTAQVLVQNRVALAEPVLPEGVKRAGVTVKKKALHAVAFVVVSSPEGRFDSSYLANYTDTNLRNELARVPGVGDIAVVGASPSRLTIWLDAEKLASHGLTAADVLQPLRDAKVTGTVPGLRADDGVAPIQVRGNSLDVEKIATVVLKSSDKGKVLLKDVARIELALSGDNAAWHDGRVVSVLAIFPLPDARASEVRNAVRAKLAELRKDFPEGLDAAVTFDRAPERKGDYLRLDLELPDGASRARSLEVAKRCEKIVREEPGVKETLALCGPPFAQFDNHVCLLVRVDSREAAGKTRAEMVQAIRTRLDEQIKTAVVRICEVPGAIPPAPLGYPVDFAVCDTTNRGDVQKVARELAEHLEKSEKLTDVAVHPRSDTVPHLTLNVDRARAQALGVATADIFSTLQVYLGSFHVNNFNEFGRTWEMQVQLDPKFRAQAEDIAKLKVRNGQGQMVSLGTLVKIETRTGPRVVSRYNMYPMVRITANPAPGVSLAEARKLCAAQAGELPAGYQLEWLPSVSVRE